MTLRHTLYFVIEERRKHLEHHFYYTSEFAQKASVSVRTLRYYDNVGLLSPTEYTEAGYRLYTDADLSRLQQILALKFLGFSLEEIRECLRIGPTVLQESLALQKAMMQEKREQLDAIIRAIDETEGLLQQNMCDWEPIVRVIQVIQMTQNNDWSKKYFTDEQQKTMEDISNKSYTAEDKQKIAEWGKNWTEADQERASQQWSEVGAELKRLVAAGQSPDSPEAQALAARWSALIQGFTHGDAGVFKGLGKWYEGYGKLPDDQKPFSLPYSKDEWPFMEKALKIYQEKQG